MNKRLLLPAIALLLMYGGCDEAVAPPDTTPPARSVTAGVPLEQADGELVFQADNPNNEAVSVRMSIEPSNDNAIYQVDGVDVDIAERFTIDAQGMVVVSIANLTNGNYTITLMTADMAGNVRDTHSLPVVGMIDSGPIPDIAVLSLTASQDVLVTNEQLDFTTRVRNAGTSVTLNSRATYYWSPDIDIDPTADIEIGVSELGTLQPGDIEKALFTTAVPSSAGVHYYGVCIDPIDGEQIQDNNCSDPIAIYALNSASETSIALRAESTSITRSASTVIHATVRNGGTIPTEAVHLVYSLLPTDDNSEIQVVRQTPLPQITAGMEHTDTYTFTSDVLTPIGKQTVRACILVNNDSDHTDNCARITLRISARPLPDLTIDATHSEVSVVQGRDITLNAQVRNSGSAPFGSTATLRYYRSQNRSISTTDIEVGVSETITSLDAGDSSGHTAVLTVPRVTGTYYYGACVEFEVERGAEASFPCALLSTVNVTQAQPDLNFSTPLTTGTTSFSTNQPVTLTVSVGNSGDLSAPGTTIVWYQSDNDTVSRQDTVISNTTTDAFAAGASETYQIDIQTPSVGGDHYYGACIEAVSGETAISNNCSEVLRIAIPYADFNAAMVAVSAVKNSDVKNGQIRLGAEVSVSASIQNIGNLSTGASRVRFYISNNSDISSSDTEIGSARISDIAAGDTFAHTVRIDAPNSGGTRYYGICVDSVAGEPNAGNNCSIGTSVRIFNPFLGNWQGYNQTTVWTWFSETRHTIAFDVVGIHYSYDCTIVYNYDYYTTNYCGGNSTYRGDVEGWFSASFSNNYNTLHTSGGDGGTRFDRQ